MDHQHHSHMLLVGMAPTFYALSTLRVLGFRPHTLPAGTSVQCQEGAAYIQQACIGILYAPGVEPGASEKVLVGALTQLGAPFQVVCLADPPEMQS